MPICPYCDLYVRDEALHLRFATSCYLMHRRALVAQAHGILESTPAVSGGDAETMRLSPRDSKTFIDALANPPEPNDALLRAAREYHNAVSGGDAATQEPAEPMEGE